MGGSVYTEMGGSIWGDIINLSAKVLDDVKAETIAPEIHSTIKKGNSIYTDEFRVYTTLNRIYNHKFVKHFEGEYVKDNMHTNTIEGFWSLLKRSIVGIYHFTSKKHLQRYVDEAVFRYNTRNINENFRFQFFLTGVDGRLKYSDLIEG